MTPFGKANKQKNNVYFDETAEFAAVTAQILGGTKEVNAKYARHIADSCNEISTLREQVENLTQERNAFQNQCIRLKNERAVEKEQLATLAEQNTLLRGFANERHDALLDQFVTAMPDLASPVLNRIRAEGMRMAAEVCAENPVITTGRHGWTALEVQRQMIDVIRAQADELEKTNG